LAKTVNLLVSPFKTDCYIEERAGQLTDNGSGISYPLFIPLWQNEVHYLVYIFSRNYTILYYTAQSFWLQI
jgi:hypothetical protein